MSDRRRHVRRIVILAAVVLALFVLARFIDVHTYVQTARAWVHGEGPWIHAAFAVGYAVATTLGAPGTPLTILAAILFGVLPAFVVMVIATTLSASLGFFVARGLARESVQEVLGDGPLRRRFDRIVAEDGWLAVPLVRVLPVFPHPFVNYAFGLSTMPYWKYIVASELVMIPMNAVWVGLADTVYGTVMAREVPWVGLGLATGFGLGLVVLIYVVKRISKAGQSTREAASSS